MVTMTTQVRQDAMFYLIRHFYTPRPFVTILYSWKLWKNTKVEFSIPVSVLHFRYASAVKKVKKCVILDQEFRAVISGTWFPNELITCMDVSCVCAPFLKPREVTKFTRFFIYSKTVFILIADFTKIRTECSERIKLILLS